VLGILFELVTFKWRWDRRGMCTPPTVHPSALVIPALPPVDHARSSQRPPRPVRVVAEPLRTR